MLPAKFGKLQRDFSLLEHVFCETISFKALLSGAAAGEPWQLQGFFPTQMHMFCEMIATGNPTFQVLLPGKFGSCKGSSLCKCTYFVREWLSKALRFRYDVREIWQ